MCHTRCNLLCYNTTTVCCEYNLNFIKAVIGYAMHNARLWMRVVEAKKRSLFLFRSQAFIYFTKLGSACALLSPLSLCASPEWLAPVEWEITKNRTHTDTLAHSHTDTQSCVDHCAITALSYKVSLCDVTDLHSYRQAEKEEHHFCIHFLENNFHFHFTLLCTSGLECRSNVCQLSNPLQSIWFSYSVS